MSEAGFLAQKPKSPTSLLIVIALHGAAITALALSKMDVPFVEDFTPLKTKHIPVEPDPPPVPPEATEPQREAMLTSVKPVMEVPPRPAEIVLPEPERVIAWTPSPGPVIADKPADPPEAEPVRVAAAMHPRGEPQPPYPASEQRAGAEGSVAIRLLIGADGRVKAAEKVRATSDAFYRATERHALRHWRFRPATLDGKPVESWKTLVVQFRLKG